MILIYPELIEMKLIENHEIRIREKRHAQMCFIFLFELYMKNKVKQSVIIHSTVLQSLTARSFHNSL